MENFNCFLILLFFIIIIIMIHNRKKKKKEYYTNLKTQLKARLAQRQKEEKEIKALLKKQIEKKKELEKKLLELKILEKQLLVQLKKGETSEDVKERLLTNFDFDDQDILNQKDEEQNSKDEFDEYVGNICKNYLEL